MKPFWLRSLIYFLCLMTWGIHSTHSQVRSYQLPLGMAREDMQKGIIIIKLKDAPGEGNPIQSSKAGIDAQLEPMFPRYQAAPNQRTGKPSRLKNLFKMTVPEGVDLISMINELLKDPNVVYAEPYFKIRPLLVPNDPEADPNTGGQTYLSVIRAYEGWEIEQGDSSQTIAILDSGIKLDHEDLQSNIRYNLNDSINGIDDDGDGLIDNFWGWDIADSDNDPTADSDGHGTEVAGQSSAATDNGLGIAGIGFRSRILPIKIFRSDNQEFNRGYEGIVMAAEQGAGVINLSWGEPGGYQQFAQDIIDFAVLEEDAVVVAAAGNTPTELDFYPASYQNVLSVGASDNQDNMASFATYSRFIDLVAPGASNYTTKNDGTYGLTSGSSFSTPLVAGAAALVRSRFPQMNALQTMEQIRISTDDIYSVGSNDLYRERMGTGRLNVEQALMDTVSPGIRMITWQSSNIFGEFAFQDDTLSLAIDLTNFLRPGKDIRVDLSSSSENVSVINPVWEIPWLSTLEQVDNKQQPFQVYLSPDLDRPDTLSFRLGFAGPNYADFQYFDLAVTPDYLELNNGTIGLTAGGNGNLAYNKNGLLEGNGLTFDQVKVLDHLGLILAADSSRVSSNAIYDFSTSIRDSSFQTLEAIRWTNNSIASIEARSSFDDTPEAENQIGLRVEQKILSFANPDLLIIDYRIINLGTDTLSNLLGGMYADWNLGDGNSNRANWEDAKNLGYISNSQDPQNWAGMALLSGQNPIYAALDNTSLNGNTADLGSTFNKSQKFDLLSAGLSDLTAGNIGAGNDVSHIVGGEIGTLAPNQTTYFSLAILKGQSLEDLITHLEEAKSALESYRQKPPIASIVATCAGLPDTIDFAHPNFRVFRDVATTQLIYQGDRFPVPPVSNDTTFYLVDASGSYQGEVERLIIEPALLQTDFVHSPDPLLFEEGGANTVSFEDRSVDASAWEWGFSHGFSSETPNPTIPFPGPGNYTATLKVFGPGGCPGTSKTRDVTVLTRNAPPVIDDQVVCEGDPAILSDSNGQPINVYTDPEASQLIFSGTTFASDPIQSDTVFYASVGTVAESRAVGVHIMVRALETSFEYFPDTANLSVKNSLVLIGPEAGDHNISWYRDGDPVGNGQSISVPYHPEDTFSLTIEVEDIEGCIASQTVMVRPTPSPMPFQQEIRVCPGETVHLAPSPGHFFYFYSDSELDNLVHKGTSYLVSDTAISRVYVTGIDSLQESSAAPLGINRVPTVANFDIAPNPLVLSDGNQVQLISQAVGSVTTQWLVDGVQLSSSADTVLTFPLPGTHRIGQIAYHPEGCQDTLIKVLEVVEVTGMPPEDGPPLLIYPNPNQGKVVLELSSEWKKPVQIVLVDVSGRRIKTLTDLTRARVEMDLLGVPEGVYLLIIQNGNFQRQVRIMIER